MKTKMLEVRDVGTCIPVMATKFDHTDGYHVRNQGLSNGSVIVTRLCDGHGRVDAFDWSGARTMSTAHQFIENMWDEFNDDDVVDIEFLLGENTRKKCKDRFFPNQYEDELNGEDLPDAT